MFDLFIEGKRGEGGGGGGSGKEEKGVEGEGGKIKNLKKWKQKARICHFVWMELDIFLCHL